MIFDTTKTTTRRTNQVRAELWVRSLAPTGCRPQQEACLQHLRQLEADGDIETFTVEVWGTHLALSDGERTAIGQRIHDRVEEFRAWAMEHGMAPDSLFSTESINPLPPSEEYTRITLPLMTLAEYEGDTLRFVSPCTDGETVHTVTDRLDALASTASAPPSSESPDNHTITQGEQP